MMGPLIRYLSGRRFSYRTRLVLLVEVFKAGIVSQAFISGTMKWSCCDRCGTTAVELLTIDTSLDPQALDLFLQAFGAHPMGGWFCSFLHYFITPGTNPLWGLYGLAFFADRCMFISLGHKIPLAKDFKFFSSQAELAYLAEPLTTLYRLLFRIEHPRVSRQAFARHAPRAYREPLRWMNGKPA